jgi:carbon monoxide dehydrogenase subunit G
MATIHRTIDVEAAPGAVWEKVSNTEGISDLIGFLASSEQTGNVRRCALDNGGSLTERIVSVDPTMKRVLYSITDSPLNMEFHAASMQVEENGGGSRLVWTIDLLPAEAVDHLAPMIDAACTDMKTSLAS